MQNITFGRAGLAKPWKSFAGSECPEGRGPSGFWVLPQPGLVLFKRFDGAVTRVKRNEWLLDTLELDTFLSLCLDASNKHEGSRKK